MKKTLLILLYLLVTSTACNGGEAKSAQIPMVAGMSQSTAIPDDTPTSTKNALRNLDQSDTQTPDPGPVDTGDAEVEEAPSLFVEPTSPPDAYPASRATLEPEQVEPVVTTDAYPGLVGTVQPEQTLPPLIAEETSVLIESKPGSIGVKSGIPTYTYTIINEYPHDRESHIQGLSVSDYPGILFEGSGLWGESSLRRVDLETGEVLQFLPLPDEYFGEGITDFDGQIIQLTWKSGVGFLYDNESFELIDEFSYAHEGWGVTYDGERLIVSDGTNTIHFWDPETLHEIDQIQVFDEFGPVTWLNELEYVDGEIFANVWQTDTIVRIDPDSGQVIGRIDLTGLLDQEERIGTEGVLNGIAYEPETERLFVTGKRWPVLYEIELVPEDAP